MRKSQIIITSFLLGAIVAPAFATAESNSPKTLRFGERGEEVKALQEILSEDSSVYPSGLTTGYFGRLTQDAVKKLQARYDLPATGVVDSDTWEIIFPRVSTIRVVNPNGGEEWEKGDVEIIRWNATIGPNSGNKYLYDTESGVSATSIIERPFYSKARIVLKRDSDPSFRMNIATVNLFDTSYRWKVPSDIRAAKDYRVEISMGYEYDCGIDRPYLERSDITYPCLTPYYLVSDQSDKPFAIYGDGAPEGVVEELKRRVLVMERQVAELQNEIDRIQKLLGEL